MNVIIFSVNIFEIDQMYLKWNSVNYDILLVTIIT